MARDIGKGYLLLTERVLLRLDRSQLDRLTLEVDKLIREVRRDQPDLADIEALRNRNQTLQRLTGGRRVIESVRMRRRSR